jgi:hypothetical protein
MSGTLIAPKQVRAYDIMDEHPIPIPLRPQPASDSCRRFVTLVALKMADIFRNASVGSTFHCRNASQRVRNSPPLITKFLSNWKQNFHDLLRNGRAL